ncbi:hypothetical protein SIO70_00090 [Chitinophaga sancti]|uniref:hypothetical protein n=1 Tax=Chitinophaga sancti TaxID=1004 RepID=UPI002A7631DE|nr:hypothetical protein [Chitinophaga sancti]WPQ63261.1 hypothetical protein SIO70_00090 [Chitinophaga sancti]
MEEPSIFDEPFFPVSRRSLLPVFLKIYIWVGMVLSGILFLGAASLMPFRLLGGIRRWEVAVGLGAEIIWAGIMFAMTALLWFERKWAVRYNWVGAGLYALSLFFVLFMGEIKIPIFIVAVLTIPYWWMLYKIQDKWENEAV